MTGLHLLTKSPSQKTKRRVGRGGKRGKTSGRGHKGQKQHGGHGIRPEIRDMIKKLPKRRGFGKNRARTVNSSRASFTPINFSSLDMFKSGETVSPETLVRLGVISKKKGRLPRVKILARGNLKIKLTFTNCAISENAKVAIEKAGGLVK